MHFNQPAEQAIAYSLGWSEALRAKPQATDRILRPKPVKRATAVSHSNLLPPARGRNFNHASPWNFARKASLHPSRSETPFLNWFLATLRLTLVGLGVLISFTTAIAQNDQPKDGRYYESAA